MSKSPSMVRTKTPGIYRRGNRYVVVWRHRGRQHKSYHHTFAEAREAKAKRQSGSTRPRSRVGFEEYFETWIEQYSGRTARGLASRSRELYRRSISDHALNRWATWRLADIEPRDVRDLYRDARDGGASTSAMRQLRSSLSALFATALEDGLIQINPVRGVRIPAAADSEEPEAEQAKALKRSELDALIKEIPSEWRLFFAFLTQSGLRISEAIGLRCMDLQVGPPARIQVREQVSNGQRRRLKSRDSRRDVPVSAEMAAALAELADGREDEEPLFTSSAGTEVNRPNLANRILKPAAARAGLTIDRDGKRVPWPSFHTFRHTCASLLFENERNVKQVADWLGHSDPGFTLRTYVHLLDAGVGGAGFFNQVLSPETWNHRD